MRALLLVVFLPGMLFGEKMNVLVCNQDRITESVIAQAEAEADIVFRAANVEVAWGKCRPEPGEGADHGFRFVIRLRNSRPPKTAGQSSLDTMGIALMTAPGEGYIADVYFQAAQEFSKRYGTELDQLLGHVIAHELGHLLLGPGHSPHSIMCSTWKRSDAMDLQRHWLKFTIAQQSMILRNLRVRNEAPR